MVCEGTGENLFLVKDGRHRHARLQTSESSAASTACRSIQIMRDLGYKVEVRDVARGELYMADEVFMTGTAAELTPIREIDNYAGRHRPARARSPARSSRCSRTRCTAARSATPSGTTWSRCRRRDVVIVYDTTLRDGMQGEGMSLSAEEKLRVAHVLDGLGVHMVEAGFPASNPKEEEFFDLLARETLRTAQVAAFGMTRRRDLAADAGPGAAPAGRRLRARVHDRRQDVVAAPREGGQGRRATRTCG